MSKKSKKLLTESEKKLLAKLKAKSGDEMFNPSLITHDNMCGLKYVRDAIPILEKLVELGKLFKINNKYSFKECSSADVTSEEDEDLFVENYRETLQDDIKKHRKFIITTAVSGKIANKNFVNAIKNFSKRQDALKMVMPCEDVASRGKKAKAIDLDPALQDFKVIFKDTYLNNNLCLCAIKVSAKQINSLTGLDRLATSRNTSIIVGATKCFLKYVPNMHFSVPLAVMTTGGAVTENNYDTDRYMCKRTSTIAENDHMFGAVIVELEDDEIFHFRFVEADESGSFIDMGVCYKPDGSIKNIEDSDWVMGDSHVGYHDKDLFIEMMKTVKSLNVSTIILHDIFNATSITHHDKDKDIERAIKANQNCLSLKSECEAVRDYLDIISSVVPNVVVVPANHNSHLEKYLESSRYVKDPINYIFSLPLVMAMTQRKNPLKVAIEDSLEYKNKSIKWLNKDESYKKYGVELGMHGHKGANGAKGSLLTFERGLGNCVTAHTHTACIIRKACSVGTTTLMDMGYNEGLSNWTRTCCVVYPNGTKQLINFIKNKKGKYTCRIK